MAASVGPQTGNISHQDAHRQMLIPIKYYMQSPLETYAQYPTHLWAPKETFGRAKVPYIGETADNETHGHPTLPTLRVLIGRC
jgi:hypothetical protein